MKIDNTDEVKELLNNIDMLFSNLDNIKKELEEKIRLKEAEQEDYLHEIELGNLNGIQLTGVAKELKQTRKERRMFKDKLELINTLKGYTDKYITKGIVADTKQAIKNVEMLESNHKTREYVPRIIKNLRCAKKEKGADKIWAI